MNNIKERFVDWTYDEFCVRDIDGNYLFGDSDYKKALNWLKKDDDACYLEAENLGGKYGDDCFHSDVLAYKFVRYDYEDTKKMWDGLFEVETPQGVADLNNMIVDADGTMYHPNDSDLWWIDDFK